MNAERRFELCEGRRSRGAGRRGSAPSASAEASGGCVVGGGEMGSDEVGGGVGERTSAMADGSVVVGVCFGVASQQQQQAQTPAMQVVYRARCSPCASQWFFQDYLSQTPPRHAKTLLSCSLSACRCHAAGTRCRPSNPQACLHAGVGGGRVFSPWSGGRTLGRCTLLSRATGSRMRCRCSRTRVRHGLVCAGQRPEAVAGPPMRLPSNLLIDVHPQI